MSTITDVAREAGVSVATVSRALRGLDRVSPTTRDKVLEVARRLNYVASPTASSLASGRTRVVGVVTPFIDRWFFAALINAIAKELRRQAHHVLLLNLDDGADQRRLELTREVLWRRVDGLITINLAMSDTEISLLDRLELPAVAVGDQIRDRPFVGIDDSLVIEAATEHLIGLGHVDIGYVGAVPANLAHRPTPATRLDAFEATMREHGLAVHPEWLFGSSWSVAGAHADALDWLTRLAAPTAVVAGSDEMATGVLLAARQAGIAVPGQLSVVGVDDHELSKIIGLTTIRQDVAAQGRQAARLLLDALVRGVALFEGSTMVPTELIVRGSTGPPPSRTG